MKLISTVTLRDEREAMLAILEDGSSFLAPVFDAKGDLIACYEGDMEELGELVGELVIGSTQSGSSLKSAEVPRSESHDPDPIPRGGRGGPKGVHHKRVLSSAEMPRSESHEPDQIPRSGKGHPMGIPDEILKMLSELARATRNLVTNLSLGTNLATR